MVEPPGALGLTTIRFPGHTSTILRDSSIIITLKSVDYLITYNHLYKSPLCGGSNITSSPTINPPLCGGSSLRAEPQSHQTSLRPLYGGNNQSAEQGWGWGGDTIP
jgi:hypothetical protein